MALKDETISTAKTLEEAIESGLKEMGLQSKEQVNIEVIEEGRKKLFGFVPYKIKLTRIKTDGEKACEFLDNILAKLGILASCELKNENESIDLEILITDSKKIVGTNGKIIDSIQSIVGAYINIGKKDYIKVNVDCDGYREKRSEDIVEYAKEIAAKAVKQGKVIKLKAMNAAERRIVHAFLSENGDLTTASEGKEPYRYIVITPNVIKPQPKKKPFGKKPFGKKPFNKDKKHFNKQGENGEQTEKKPFSKDKKPFNKDRKPFNKDKNSQGERKPYNKDKNPFNKQGENGEQIERKPFNKDRKPYNKDGKNFQTRDKVSKPKKQIYFGTYLGNDEKEKKD